MLNSLKRLVGSRVTRNAGWLIAGEVANKIIAFAVSIYTARYLGPSNYGLVNYAAAYTTFFLSLASLGINNVVVKKIIDDPQQEGTSMGTMLVLQGIASIISILMILGITMIVDHGEPITIVVVFLSSLGLLFQVLGGLKYWFQAKLQSKYAAIAATVAYLATSLYKIVLLVLGMDVRWFAITACVDYLCAAVLLFWVYKRKKGPKLRFSLPLAGELLKSSYPYIFSGLMISVYVTTDKLMLKQMLGEEIVGYYVMAVAISNIWAFILSAIVESLNPVIMELYNSDKAAFRKKNVQMYRLVFYMSMAASLVITLFAELGVRFLYGEAYMGAVMPLRIITWYVGFSQLGTARNIWVVCQNQQKHLTGIYAGAAVVNVVFNALLIPMWGACGAAVATLITQISTVFVVPCFIKGLRPNVKLMREAIFFK